MTKPKPRFVRSCAGCGDETTKRKWCSESCRNRWRYSNDDSYRSAHREQARKPLRIPTTCEWCGSAFAASARGVRCCSTSCASLLRFSGQTCPISPTQCRHCGSWRSRKAKGCGCVAPLTATERAALVAPRACESCGEEFQPKTPAGFAARFCSVKCRQREAAARHDMRRFVKRYGTKIGKVRRLAIYERDEWRCQLCGDPVDPNLPVQHARAATLDHIIPRSRGGDHSEENLQLAHRSCNSSKKDRMVEAA